MLVNNVMNTSSFANCRIDVEQSKVNRCDVDAAIGPGLLSTPLRSSRSATRTALGDGRLLGKKTCEPSAANSSRRSTLLSNDEDTMIDAGHSSMTTAVDPAVVVMVAICMTEQSTNNTIATENMAVD